MKQSFSFLFTLLLFLIASTASAQDEASKWTAKDVIYQERAGELEFSPNGTQLVWVKRRADKKEDKFISDLYLTRLDLKEDGKFKNVQLTRGKESDHSPLFSKDGETIYFLSSRDKGKKLWAMSVYGGEAYEVHTFETGISDIAWLNDKELLFESEEGKTLYEQEMEEQEDNTVVVEDTVHFKPSRMYSFNLENKEVSRLTDNEFPVGEYAISKDGRQLVTSHVRSPDYGVDANPKSTYYLWNLEKGTKRQILQDEYQTPGDFEFSEDNKGFYFMSVQSSDPDWNGAGISMLHYYNLAENKVQNVPLNWDWGLGSGYDLIGNDVIVGLANGATVKLAYLEKDGDQWSSNEIDTGSMDEHVTITAVGKDHKKLAYVYSNASTPPQYRLAEMKINRNKISIPKGDELITLNSDLDKKHKAKSEVMTWTGAMDDEVTGILYYPKDYEEGRSYPLVVSIHGGPSGVDTDSWSESWAYFPNIYSQKGAFVLMPNYHGSSNHGQEFVESIKGHYYEYELPDIVAGINKLVDVGKVNPDSMGVKGWSNGAILTTMLTVQHPDMFKVAAPGAGDVNWTSDYGTCRFGVSFDQSYFGGAPWDDTDGKIYNSTYIQKSPLFEMEKVRTPTIIFHGSEDRAVPRDQGWEYYRALQQIGEAPVRFLWFPGQPHGLQKVTHQTRKMEEEIQWFDRYLFGTFDPENEAFKEDSPLAELLKKDKAKMTNGTYGIMQDNKLIPELVQTKKDSISIGRFEVTNAQYAAYKTFDYPPARANYPVSRLSIKEVQAYISWLNKRTGETYRLPTADEAKRLHKQAQESAATENTLNYWAGYELGMEDVAELKEKLTDLDHSLLKEVGSYKPTKIGDAYIYDLGGNVAEWDATGHVYGYAAVSYVDERAEAKQPPVKYIGFRLVRD